MGTGHARRGHPVELNATSALDRTALLIRDDVLGRQVAAEDIVANLLSERVQITASAASLATAAAQTATVALTLHLTMCGIGVDLDFPDVPMAAPQPPLPPGGLHTALSRHVGAAWPWVAQGETGQPAMRFVIGETTPRCSTDIVVAGSATAVRVGRASAVQGTPWEGDDPVAATGAGIAAAILSLRAAFQRMATLAGVDLAHQTSSTTIDVAVEPMPKRPMGAGLVPVVSAGAITHGALFVLLRASCLDASFHVFDRDDLDVTNLNRYSLATVTDLGEAKVDGLSRLSPSATRSGGEARHYQAGDGRGAARILIGADDIPARWTAQDDAAGWLGVGATSHLFAQVSTHTPGTPCAGCVHPVDDEVPATIPTISVISGWAGLTLAQAFLRSDPVAGDNLTISSYPLGLGGAHAINASQTRRNPRCPRRCEAQTTG